MTPEAIRQAREQLELVRWLTTPARQAIETGLALLEQQTGAVTFLPAAGGDWLVNGRPVRAGRNACPVSLAWHSIAWHTLYRPASKVHDGEPIVLGAPVDLFTESRSRSAAINMLTRAREWAERNAPELVAAFEALRVRGDVVVFDAPATIRVNVA